MQIAKYVEQQRDQLDGLATRVDTSIETLAEYRSALVTAAVTGHIKGPL